jgi:hypothetical protein
MKRGLKIKEQKPQSGEEKRGSQEIKKIPERDKRANKCKTKTISTKPSN